MNQAIQRNTLNSIYIPGVKKIHQGKVRDSFYLNKEERLIITTDRISAFDSVLNFELPYKGAILNSLSNFWFKKTSSIIKNHLILQVDPNIMIAKNLIPIKLEVIVRGFLTGSLWNEYHQNGRREFDGYKLKDELKQYSKIENMVLFTTKDKKDVEISRKQILERNIVTPFILEKIIEKANALFSYGQSFLEDKGILLVDTKYEFGVSETTDDLYLIDEIHTPDSSRFWDKEIYKLSMEEAAKNSLDKEFLRSYLKSKYTTSSNKDFLPDQTFINELSKRYQALFEKITTENIKDHVGILPIKERILFNLKSNSLLPYHGTIVMIMGAKSDLDHALKIKKVIESYPNIFCELRVVSAHKNGERIVQIAKEYNEMVGPVSVIAVAGKSNALGGALAMNFTRPVINCPLFNDRLDLLMNVNSSLLMPSKTPIATTIDPDSAAILALKNLQLAELDSFFLNEIYHIKNTLNQHDLDVRGVKHYEN